jgi:hypothetical protein
MKKQNTVLFHKDFQIVIVGGTSAYGNEITKLKKYVESLGKESGEFLYNFKCTPDCINKDFEQIRKITFQSLTN